MSAQRKGPSTRAASLPTSPFPRGAPPLRAGGGGEGEGYKAREDIQSSGRRDVWGAEGQDLGKDRWTTVGASRWLPTIPVLL